jgi:uncharacterized membrane protein/membrane-bound inhibitor of C-type lysozyme
VSVWAAVAVVLVLAVQLVLREPADAPTDATTRREQLPAVDASPEPDVQPTPLPAPSTDLERPEPLRAAASDAAEEVDAGDSVRASQAASRRFMYRCANGPTFGVAVRGDRAMVFTVNDLGGGSLTLVQTEAASGERYAAGDTVYWNKGDVATFEIDGQVFADCASDPGMTFEGEARRRGATFVARGNEPSWNLEITRDRLELAAQGRRLEFPLRSPTVVGPRTTYRTFLGTQELVVVLDRGACNDSVSGELFDHAVTVTFEGTTVYGCGRAPR